MRRWGPNSPGSAVIALTNISLRGAIPSTTAQTIRQHTSDVNPLLVAPPAQTPKNLSILPILQSYLKREPNSTRHLTTLSAVAIIVDTSIQPERTYADFSTRGKTKPSSSTTVRSTRCTYRRITSVTHRNQTPASTLKTFNRLNFSLPLFSFQLSAFRLVERDRKQEPGTALL